MSEENQYLKIILLDKVHSIDVPKDLTNANKHMLTIEIDKFAKENEDFYGDEDEDFDDYSYEQYYDLARHDWFDDSD